MKRFILSAAFLAFCFTIGVIVQAGDVVYLGKFAGEEVGLIRIEGQDHEVSVGTMIDHWGTVTEITDTHVVIRRVLSEVEKADLEAQGAAVYDAIRIYLPHQGLRVVPIPQ
jgi:hypothetical protein